jgi:GntR family transcriptional regulator, transcriptional repressor for pyruvate dehydrogenase complex
MSGRRIRNKLSEEVSTGLVEMIRKQRLETGENIPTESELADTFQVSRTAVREGVKSLVAIGVLETRHGIGTFVKDPNLGPLRNPRDRVNGAELSELLDLLEFRRIVERETAALASQRRSPSDLIELERCVMELEKGIAAGIKPAEDIGFHLALARAAKNSALVDATYLIFRFYENDPSLPDNSDLQSHRAVYEAVRDKNPDAARQAIMDHFSILEKRYRSKAKKNRTMRQ